MTEPDTARTDGGAFARAHDTGWAVGTGRITLDLAAAKDHPLRATRLALTDGPGWLLDATAPWVSLTTDTGDISDLLVVTGGRSWAEDDSARLEITLAAPDGTQVRMQIEARDDQAFLRQWLEVEAADDLAIARSMPARVALARDAAMTLHTVSGVQQQGGWRPAEGPYTSFKVERTPLDAPLHHHPGIRSTWERTPWAAVTGADAAAGGVIVALEYGAQWEMTATPDRETVTVAIAPDGIVPRIAAGERWVSPAAWIGAFPGDLDSAAAAMHRYLRETVMPPTPDDFPWVQYNTWFSYYCDLDEETLLAEADLAAALGVEVFYVDAGWWVGNPMRRDRFSSGLGNWLENRDKFPSGLRAFAEAIRAKGMHFGIWVEPERVDLRTAVTGTWDPAWIARTAEGPYVRCPWPQDTDTAWLCFGHAETQAWAERWIGELVEELGVRWLKWDSNYWDVCHSGDHGHGASDGERAQVEGVYAVMARLRERFPDLIIENCAGGATRLDFAITRQTHAAWLNDASEPAHRSRFHIAGASYLFPPAMLNAWVTESEHENVNGQDLPEPAWRAVIRSRMLGAMGFSCRIGTWSDGTRAIAAEEVARYKGEIRPLLRDGAFHHLLQQPEIPSRDLPTPNAWEAYQFSAADDSRHVVLGFRNVAPDDGQPVAPRLDPDATYRVTADGAEPHTRSGRELSATGLALSAPLLGSTWVSIEREGCG